MPEGNLSSRTEATPSRFRFSLFRLMVAITLFAILFGVMAGFGEVAGIALAVLLWCVLPTPLVILGLFGRRDIQAFSIGGLVPWCTMLLTQRVPSTSMLQGIFGVVVALLWMIVLSATCGAVAVATRRWLDRQRPRD